MEANMQTYFSLPLVAAALSTLILSACSHGETHKEAEQANRPTVQLALLPDAPLEAGRPVTVHAKLIDIKDKYLLINSDLQTIHTSTFHLLLIDPTMTDYQHIH